MLRDKYPPLNMHFIVQFSGSEFDNEIHFQSVDGLKARICENENKSGTYVKFDNLILKRAYQPDSKLHRWCMDAINYNKEKPLNLNVYLLNAQHEPISTWKIEKATPVAWGVDELNAQESKILIETIELTYHRFQIVSNLDKTGGPKMPITRKKKI